MTADVLGPAIGALEHELTAIDERLAACQARRTELTQAIATMRRVAGHPDPEAGLYPVTEVTVTLDGAAIAAAVAGELPRGPHPPAAADADAVAVLDAIRSGATSARQIRAAHAMSPSRYRQVIERLVRTGQVTVTGLRAGARYTLPASRAPRAAADAAKEAQRRPGRGTRARRGV